MCKNDFLEPDHPDAFRDYPKMDRTEYGPTGDECPKCKGHGGWNLRLNAYPLHDMEDTPENRHRYSHFRASCGACWGWGYLQEGQTCAHEWVNKRTVGNCLHEWECTKCGATREVDSSD